MQLVEESDINAGPEGGQEESNSRREERETEETLE